MKKRLLSLSLVLIVVFAFIPAPALAADYVIGSVESLRCAVGIMQRRDCVLAAVSSHAVVYVMRDNNFDAGFLPSGSTPHANAQKIADEFDVIYNMLSVRGSPYYTGVPLLPGGSEKVTIILLDIDSDGTGSGIPAGYSIGRFVASSTISAKDDMLIYMDISTRQGGSRFTNAPERYFAALAHEYQH
jgi:hypothetical protein